MGTTAGGSARESQRFSGPHCCVARGWSTRTSAALPRRPRQHSRSPRALAVASRQVSDFSFENGQLVLQCAEAVVNSVKLRFLDPATGQPKDKVRTKPHIITRHLSTKPGQVIPNSGTSQLAAP
jgi:hypothetical protein